jgi:hypothetical protein
MFPVGTFVEIVANTRDSYDIAYRHFQKGEKKFYKVIEVRGNYTDFWGYNVPRSYRACLVNLATGKRKGSWEYFLQEKDIIPVVIDVNFEEWL